MLFQNIRLNLSFTGKPKNCLNDPDNNASIPFYRKLVEPSLSLSSGALLIYKTLDLFVCPPKKLEKHYSFTYSPIYRLVDNPRDKLKIYRVFRAINISIITWAIFFSLCRLVWLKQHWKEIRGMEQLFLYMVILCMCNWSWSLGSNVQS